MANLGQLLYRVAPGIAFPCGLALLLARSPEVRARQAADPPPHHSTVMRPWPVLAKAKLGIQIPAPIGGGEIQRYKQLLTLSDAQAVYLDGLHQHYSEQCRLMELESAPLIIEAADQFSTLLRPNSPRNAEFIALHENWVRQEARFGRRIEAEDGQLFNLLETALTDDQKAILPRVKLYRDRARMLPPRWFGTPKSAIDLSAMVDDMNLPHDERDQLDAIRWEYERAFTAVLSRATEIYSRNRTSIEEARYRAHFNEQGVALDPQAPGVIEHMRKIGDEITDMYARQGAQQLRLAAINDDYVVKFVEHMNDRDGISFRDAYKSLAFRRVYPDGADPSRILDGIETDPNASNELQALLAEQRLAYRREYERVCATMEKLSTEWDERYAMVNATNGWNKHIAALTELAMRRIELNLAIVEKQMLTLPEPIASKHRGRVDDWKQVVARAREEIMAPRWQQVSNR